LNLRAVVYYAKWPERHGGPDRGGYVARIDERATDRLVGRGRERRRYHETFRDMVVEGQQAGVFRGDVSAELAVDYFFGSVHHLPMWWRPRGRLSGVEVGRSFADLFISGLR